MAAKRTYGDPCGIARALDVVGERWALLVVRELLLGPKRFTDLRTGLPHLSPDVLSQRLRELEGAGVLHRRKLAPPAASQVYELTARGRELEPILLSLGRWGTGVPFVPGEAPLGADSSMLALKTLFDPAAAGDLDATFELRLGEQHFRARIGAGELDLVRGTAEAPDAVIETDSTTLATVLWHGYPLTDALRAGDVRIDGSRPAVERFLRLFAQPTNVPG
jgi:DNA-binding HxlR family transcriptional regulator